MSLPTPKPVGLVGQRIVFSRKIEPVRKERRVCGRRFAIEEKEVAEPSIIRNRQAATTSDHKASPAVVTRKYLESIALLLTYIQ
jgi:hypothetical protein